MTLAQLLLRPLILFAPLLAFAQPVSVTVDLKDGAKAVSPDLVGVFFEDLNYAADGGLYAELIQNRSFEYQQTERTEWNNLSAWEQVIRGDGKANFNVDVAVPVHPNNPHYAVLEVERPGEGVGLVNSGFDGIPVVAGDHYRFSIQVRLLFTGGRWAWGPDKKTGPVPMVVRLEKKDGSVLAETSFDVTDRDWRRFEAVLTPSQNDEAARLAVLVKGSGGVALDEISLFPEKTFHNRKNGLRADLAQAIADLKPKFMRFPGGCLVHGSGLGNLYRWKDTIGPVEQRRQQANLWGYHQSVGLGYFEFFQFCEDIGAKPLPVVPAGVCCQNADHQGGTGQRGLPLEQMDALTQDVLDLIEYANGPATSTWGAKRAAAGHPEPFGLKYIGIGNEEAITPVFKERFEIIYKVVKARHPEIVVIGTAGPFPAGEDFEKGWSFVNECGVPMIDEHYYQSPQWFWDNQRRYDGYDRAKAQVYVGEYAAHDKGRRMTLASALAEAAHLTSLERNADVVRFASYAPLLGRLGHTQWNPDLIYFDGTRVYPSINYEVQRLFGNNGGDQALAVSLGDNVKTDALAVSALRDSASGDLILKFVNGASTTRALRVKLAGVRGGTLQARKSVLAHPDASVVNEAGKAPVVKVTAETLSVSAPAFDYEVPAHSLTVLRINP